MARISTHYDVGQVQAKMQGLQERADRIGDILRDAPLVDQDDRDEVLLWASQLQAEGVHLYVVEAGIKKPKRGLPGRRGGYSQADATTDLEQLSRIYEKGDNLGVCLGPSNLLVVDADTPAEVEAWTLEAESHGCQIAAPTTQTPGNQKGHSGGGHWWYVVQDDEQRLEKNKTGRYTFSAMAGDLGVLLPGSRREDAIYADKPYYVVSGSVGVAEGWMVDLCQDYLPPAPEKAEYQPTGDPIDDWAEGTSWAQILLPEGWSRANRRATCGAKCEWWNHPAWSEDGSAIAHQDCGEGRGEVLVPMSDNVDAQGNKFQVYRDLHGLSSTEARAALGLENTPAQEDEDDLLDLLSLDDLRTIPPAAPLVDRILYRDTLARISGEPGAYKTFLALGLACSVALGKDWGPYKVPEAGRVLYIAAEGRSGLQMRLAGWCEANGVDMAALSGQLDVFPGVVSLADEKQVARAIRTNKARSYALIVFDTLARMAVGMEENSAKEMGVAVEAVEQIRQAADSTALVVHHVGKNSESGRGSSAWAGAVWTEAYLRKKDHGADLRIEKAKDAEVPPTQRFETRNVRVRDEWLPVGVEEDRQKYTLAVVPTGNAPVHNEQQRSVAEDQDEADLAWLRGLRARGVSPQTRNQMGKMHQNERPEANPNRQRMGEKRLKRVWSAWVDEVGKDFPTTPTHP